MKKGEAKPEQIYVAYKGTRFLLQPGHKVFECNTDTGIVKEHKIRKSFTWFWLKGTTYRCTYQYNLIHTSAFNIEKAVIAFSHLMREVVKERKKEGNPLIIKAIKQTK